MVNFKKLHKDAIIPKYMTSDASGMDITTVESGIIALKSFRIFKTGLAVEIPFGYEIQMRSRSGLAAKFGVFILNGIGTIDQGYRGELMAILCNMGNESYEVKAGDRVAQLVISKTYRFEIGVTTEFDKTERWNNGFGSTGR